MADTPEAIRKSIRTYVIVGLVLFVGTALTWAVANVPALDVGDHGFDKWDAILGLCIACVKATFVAAIFMHLNHEKKGIYWIFFGSFVFFAALIGLVALAKSDPNSDPYFYQKPAALSAPAAPVAGE